MAGYSPGGLAANSRRAYKAEAAGGVKRLRWEPRIYHLCLPLCGLDPHFHDCEMRRTGLGVHSCFLISQSSSKILLSDSVFLKELCLGIKNRKEKSFLFSQLRPSGLHLVWLTASRSTAMIQLGLVLIRGGLWVLLRVCAGAARGGTESLLCSHSKLVSHQEDGDLQP